MSDLRELQALRERLLELDRNLRDYWMRLTHLQTSIIETHPHTGNPNAMRGPMIMVTRWTKDGAEKRFGLFAAMDRLNQTYAPIKNERRIVAAQVKELTSLLKKEATKRPTRNS